MQKFNKHLALAGNTSRSLMFHNVNSRTGVSVDFTHDICLSFSTRARSRTSLTYSETNALGPKHRTH